MLYGLAIVLLFWITTSETSQALLTTKDALGLIAMSIESITLFIHPLVSLTCNEMSKFPAFINKQEGLASVDEIVPCWSKSHK